MIRQLEYRDNKYSDDVKSLNIDSNRLRSNRYGNKYTLTTNDGTYTRSLQIEDLVAKISTTDRYMVVPIELQYDPYRIAHQFYSDRDLYWVILAANRVLDPFDLVEGMTIRIPDLASIYGINGLLSKIDE